MPGHVHQKQWHQVVGNSDVYQQTKNKLEPSIFLEKRKSDWPRIFWAITPEEEFCWAWSLQWKIEN